MIAADLLLSLGPGTVSPPEVNPLVEQDALLEAQVLDVRLDAMRGVLGVLFELRVAMLMRESNVGVLVASGVEDFRWVVEPRRTGLTAWNVLASSVEQEPAGLRFSIGCYPDAEMSLRARSLVYLNCHADEIGEVPPDYTGDVEMVRASVVRWESEIDVVSGSSCRSAT